MSAQKLGIAKEALAIYLVFMGVNVALLLAALINGHAWQAAISAFVLGAVGSHLYHLREASSKE